METNNLISEPTLRQKILLIDSNVLQLHRQRILLSEALPAVDIRSFTRSDHAYQSLCGKTDIHLIICDYDQAKKQNWECVKMQNQLRKKGLCIARILLLTEDIDGVDLSDLQDYDNVIGVWTKPISADRLNELLLPRSA